MVVVTNSTRGVVLADRAEVACGLLKRMTGLLTRQRLPAGEALIFPHCRSIHTCFMRFPIDVLFLKTIGNGGCGMRNAEWLTYPALRTPHSAWVVMKVVQHLRPFRFTWAQEADTVIELPLGTIARTATQMGERLIAVEIEAR